LTHGGDPNSVRKGQTSDGDGFEELWRICILWELFRVDQGADRLRLLGDESAITWDTGRGERSERRFMGVAIDLGHDEADRRGQMKPSEGFRKLYNTESCENSCKNDCSPQKVVNKT